MSDIVNTPEVPYYAVIFTSIRTEEDNGYEKVSDELLNIVSQQKGFLGAESVRNKEGFGVTISYWDSLESIQIWKHNLSHQKAKELGKTMWYSSYRIRICKVSYDNCFTL